MKIINILIILVISLLKFKSSFSSPSSSSSSNNYSESSEAIKSCIFEDSELGIKYDLSDLQGLDFTVGNEDNMLIVDICGDSWTCADIFNNENGIESCGVYSDNSTYIIGNTKNQEYKFIENGMIIAYKSTGVSNCTKGENIAVIVITCNPNLPSTIIINNTIDPSLCQYNFIVESPLVCINGSSDSGSYSNGYSYSLGSSDSTNSNSNSILSIIEEIKKKNNF